MKFYHCDQGPIYEGKVFNRTTLIIYLFNKYKYKSYLEIGHGQGHNWRQMGFINNKKCVDPFMGAPPVIRKTSDSFFEDNKDTYDLIFIDGDHTAEQVYKDIINSLEFLNENGIILTHDNSPPEKKHESKSNCGTSWRTIPLLRTRKDLDICTFNSDLGIGMIKKRKNSNLFKAEDHDEMYQALSQTTQIPDFNLFHYDWLEKKRSEVLNLLNIEEMFKWLKGEKYEQI